jgi:SAM-dependent methyltransferase
MQWLDTRHTVVPPNYEDNFGQRAEHDGGGTPAELHHYLVTQAIHWLDAHDVKNPSILDIGCGNGLFGELFRDVYHRPFNITGVDLQFSAFREKHLASRGYKLQSGDFLKTTFTQRFDLAIASHVLEHISPETLPQWFFQIRRFSRYCLVASPIALYTFAWHPFYLAASRRKTTDCAEDAWPMLVGATHQSMISESLLRPFGYQPIRSAFGKATVYYSHMYISDNDRISDERFAEAVDAATRQAHQQHAAAQGRVNEILAAFPASSERTARPMPRRDNYERTIAFATAREPKRYRMGRLIINIFFTLLSPIKWFVKSTPLAYLWGRTPSYRASSVSVKNKNV